MCSECVVLYVRMCIGPIYILTFGVSCPTTRGATIPGIVAVVLDIPNNMLANLERILFKRRTSPTCYQVGYAYIKAHCWGVIGKANYIGLIALI